MLPTSRIAGLPASAACDTTAQRCTPFPLRERAPNRQMGSCEREEDLVRLLTVVVRTHTSRDGEGHPVRRTTGPKTASAITMVANVTCQRHSDRSSARRLRRAAPRPRRRQAWLPARSASDGQPSSSRTSALVSDQEGSSVRARAARGPRRKRRQCASSCGSSRRGSGCRVHQNPVASGFRVDLGPGERQPRAPTLGIQRSHISSMPVPNPAGAPPCGVSSAGGGQRQALVDLLLVLAGVLHRTDRACRWRSSRRP